GAAAGRAWGAARGGRSEPPGAAAPNRSGDGAPASPHRRLGSRYVGRTQLRTALRGLSLNSFDGFGAFGFGFTFNSNSRHDASAGHTTVAQNLRTSSRDRQKASVHTPSDAPSTSQVTDPSSKAADTPSVQVT